MARVLVTGGSGFIGGALLRAPGRARRRGRRARPLGRVGRRSSPARGAQVARGDVLDEDVARRGRCAAASSSTTWPASTRCARPTRRSCSTSTCAAPSSPCARRPAPACGRVVLTSSAAALGEARGTVGTEDSPHRGEFLSVYERSKHEGEAAAFAAGRAAGVDVVAVNPSSVQGPGRAGGTGRILIAYLNGRLKAFVDTTHHARRHRRHRQGHLLAAERGVPGRALRAGGRGDDAPARRSPSSPSSPA